MPSRSDWPYSPIVCRTPKCKRNGKMNGYCAYYAAINTRIAQRHRAHLKIRFFFDILNDNYFPHDCRLLSPLTDGVLPTLVAWRGVACLPNTAWLIDFRCTSGCAEHQTIYQKHNKFYNYRAKSCWIIGKTNKIHLKINGSWIWMLSRLSAASLIYCVFVSHLLLIARLPLISGRISSVPHRFPFHPVCGKNMRLSNT